MNMNFESELFVKQPLVYASDVSKDYSKTAHNAFALERNGHITKKCGKKCV